MLQSFLGVGDNKEEVEDEPEDFRPPNPSKFSINNDAGSERKKGAGCVWILSIIMVVCANESFEDQRDFLYFAHSEISLCAVAPSLTRRSIFTQGPGTFPSLLTGSDSHAPLIDIDTEPGEMDSFLHQPGFSSADPDPPDRTFSLPTQNDANAGAGATANGLAQNQLSPPNADSAAACAPADSTDTAHSQEGS